MSKFLELLKTSDVHCLRIIESLDNLKGIYPVNESVLNKLSKDQMLWIELLISRFSKLQDFLGAKLIDSFLDSLQEKTDGLAMLDKIHKLEKLGVIESSEDWREMRELRNHLSHEYPDHPEIMASFINDLFELTPKLLQLYDNIKSKAPK